MSNPVKEVLKANLEFYRAFAASDYQSLVACWSSSEQISVTHPGSSAIHGRKAVLKGWQLILENSGGKGIRCTHTKAYVFQGFAYVICEELVNESRLNATNIFVLEQGSWRMVHHQASVNNEVAGPDPEHSLH